MKEHNSVSRRDALRGLASVSVSTVLANALAACSTAPREEPPLELSDKEGKLVSTVDILKQPIPIEEWKKLDLQSHNVVIVVDKERKILGMFENGLLTRVSVAGTAKRGDGYVTPDGQFTITRLEGLGYTSKEYPGAKMDYASFFGTTGRAIHASANFHYRYNREREAKEWYLHVDNSHGCVNVMDADALAINDMFRKYGNKGKVIVR
jgi:lipoprotein-anchoring transpeptidase ErfK/SrfK